MTSKKIKELFLDFFKQRGHAIVPSSSLISDDPSVLLVTAGMQQFKKYFTGELDALKDFGSQQTASIQRCFRTSDIDAVGDESHLTFLEMLGNFSFGGYFKKEAIEYAYDFITKAMELGVDYVTIFDPVKVPEGDWRKNDVPFDQESHKTWKNIGIPEEKIKREGTDNFWGPTGNEGPCGPTTEIYVKNIQGKSIEVWNIVFNEFYCDKDKKLTKLKTPGVDTGMGLERLAMMAQNKETVVDTDLFEKITELLSSPELSKPIPDRTKRIIADHIRGIAFLIADGVRPSNKEAGYVLRRLMRRVIVYEYLTGDPSLNFKAMLQAVITGYREFYPELKENTIYPVYDEENSKFLGTVQKSLKELNRLTAIDAQSAFKLYESFGLPYEVIKEFGGTKTKHLKREDFDEEFKKHQEISRAGLDKKFGGHGLKENGEIVGVSEDEKQKIIKLHTATHLLHQALCDLFGDKIKQMGSDINPDRLRFDFPFERKLASEEIAELEKKVNQKIKEKLPVSFEEKTKEEAFKEGAKAFFKAKYPDKVKVYSIGPSTSSGQAYSQEICNGPHVGNTSEIGQFKILKEESIGAGVRRIRATVE